MHRYSTSLLAAGLAMCGALSSCVDDKIINGDQGDPIGFLTDVNTHSRSSLIHTTENLDSFHVYAYCPDGTVFFDNLHVQKADPDYIDANYYQLNWEIEGGPYFYPRDAAWVDYYVYRYISGIEGGYGTTPDASGELPPKLDVNPVRQMIHEFKPYDRIENQEDLIIEHRRSYNNEVSGVELHFHHALTQVELKAFAPNNNVRVVVAGAWFCNIINQGDVYWPNLNPELPNNGFGKADDQLFWILPDRVNPDIPDPVETAWSKHSEDWKMAKVADRPHRSHYGTFFNEPITLGFSAADAPADYVEPEPVVPERPDDPIASPDNPLHDCTDYDDDGVCDHLVYPEDLQRGTYVSRLLTSRSDDRDAEGTRRPLNLLIAPQQLVGYNKNRDEAADKMFYDEDETENNHGAYILLAIQIYNIHGTEEHMHRHLIFPYNGPEHWDVNGNLVNSDGNIIDFLGNRLDPVTKFPVNNETGEPIYDTEGNRIDNYGHKVDPDTGDVLNDKGQPIKDNYNYSYISDGKGDPDFKWNKTFGWVCIPIDDLWEPGHKYTYILEFMGQNSGAGIYPPDDFDFTDLVKMDHYNEVRNGYLNLSNGNVDAYDPKRPWFNADQAAADDYIKNVLGYTIIPSQEVRLRDPGTMNSQKHWVGKKQGDPVLSKPIDFKVTVDEWINDNDWKLDMEEYGKPSVGNGGKQPVTK